MILNNRMRAGHILVTGLLALVLIVSVLASPVHAATEPLYIAATGHYVQGVFRNFWDTNNGMVNFGYPITDEYIDPTSGRIVQYYERARFERENPAATVVYLAMLGREVSTGRVFTTSSAIANTKTRRYFSETSQIVQYGFKEIWEKQGGLAIFGLPISSEIQEQLEDGTTRTTQYFERSRFEYHPEFPDGQRVLISLLGRKLAPAALTTPLAPGSTPPPLTPLTTTPVTLKRPLIPASNNATVSPAAALAGQTFTFTASGFNSGEDVALWSAAPDGTVTPFESRVKADTKGTLDTAAITFSTKADAASGIWSIVAQGVTSNKTATGYLLIVSTPISRLPEPTPTPAPAKPIPTNVNARSEPSAGSAGTIFFFDARGFTASEDVQVVITVSNGSVVKSSFALKADQLGSIGYAGIYYVTVPGAPLGLYTMTATGQESKKIATAYFVLTT
ncbi:MAG: hypothetical protein SH847_09240 [Roseiflexaceae bacterium]|nr:hypothetical protein [Roseiflexaceae bacterium]